MNNHVTHVEDLQTNLNISPFPFCQAAADFSVQNSHFKVFPLLSSLDDFLTNAKQKKQISESSIIAGNLQVDDQPYVIIQDLSPSTRGADHQLFDVLTGRELQITCLVAHGCSNKQISKQLNISPWTVSAHLRRIFIKLDVDTRAALVYQCAGLLHDLQHICAQKLGDRTHESLLKLIGNTDTKVLRQHISQV